jgi:superfamily II DNA/RNA helicase
MNGIQNDDCIEKSELDLLVSILRKSLNENKRKSIIVFADSKKMVDKICEFLREREIKSLCYYPEITV